MPLGPVRRMARVADISARGGLRALARRLWSRPTSEDDEQAFEAAVAELGALKGVPMQLGQLLSYAPIEVPDHTRRALSKLHTHAQPIPFEQIRQVVRRELGVRGDELLSNMDPKPVSVGALGQVHRSELADGSPVDVKVQYPGVAVAIGRDLGPAALAARLSSWFDRDAQRKELVREVRARLLEECDYRNEARRREEFAALFAYHDAVRIPRSHAHYSTSRVLTTERAEGMSLDRFLQDDPSQERRDRAGNALFDFYFGSLFRNGLYNCDAQPGNFLLDADGRVTIVEHGCCRSFDNERVEALAALTRAVDTDDPETLHLALVGMGFVDGKRPYELDYARDVLRWFYATMLTDERSRFPADVAVPLSSLAAHRAHARGVVVPGECVFLLRMRVGLAHALSQLDARANWCAQQRELVDAGNPVEVVLSSAGPNTIALVRELRAVQGGTVRRAADTMKKIPCSLETVPSRVAASKIRRRLESAGATVELNELDEQVLLGT